MHRTGVVCAYAMTMALRTHKANELLFVQNGHHGRRPCKQRHDQASSPMCSWPLQTRS